MMELNLPLLSFNVYYPNYTITLYTYYKPNNNQSLKYSCIMASLLDCRNTKQAHLYARNIQNHKQLQ